MVQIYKQNPATPKQAAKRPGPLDRALRSDFFKALSDPTRNRLLICLAKCSRACSVTEISQCCEIDFSVVSRHLAYLSRAGILTCAKEGRVVRYQVRYHEVTTALRALAEAFDSCCQTQPGECCHECS